MVLFTGMLLKPIFEHFQVTFIASHTVTQLPTVYVFYLDDYIT